MRGLAVAAWLLVALPGPLGASSPLEEAFTRYWKADDPKEARREAERILAAGPPFAEVLSRLQSGRPYEDGRTGLRSLSRMSSDGVRHRYMVLVPESYDPGRRYPVRVYLHGGVNRPAWDGGGDWWRAPERHGSPDRIVVFPAGWSESLWWEGRQVENLSAILDRLGRRYNVDENRVSLLGVSDGATGVWFHALRAPTRWSAFVSLIGHPAVLANRSLRVDGQIYPANLAHRSVFVVNGGRDRLYPAAGIVPYLELFRSAGAGIVFRPRPEAGHTVSWWPEEAATIDAFLAAHTRDPLPDEVVWETEDPERYGRVAWVRIDELGPVAGESELPPLDEVGAAYRGPSLGVRPDPTSDDGVLVLEVFPDSAAAQGLRRGDRIVAVAGEGTATVAELAAGLRGATWGERIDLVVERDGRRESVSVVLPAAPPEAAERRLAFPHPEPSGRVVASRRENAVELATRGVRRLTLLLSPTELDFAQPIAVEANGLLLFSRRVEPRVATLLRWAARDDDRSMLFGVELSVDLVEGRVEVVDG